jgi:hypothetical protein
MPNLIPQDIREWMRRIEFKTNDLTRRMSTLIPGDIADGVDLDGFVSTGRWIRQSTTGTTTALHYPYDGIRGVLEVYWNPDYAIVRQVFFGGGSVWSRTFDVTWGAWVPADDPNLPTHASITDASTQNIASATLADLPSTVTATLPIPPGTFEVDASVSGMWGTGNGFAPSASASLRYHLSGAITFSPGSTTAGVAGVDQPIANGGGTLRRTHTVTVTTTTNLTITAKAIRHVGAANVPLRDVIVQLLVVRRD